ncbi:unnamed protein product [Heligmosomoides polygyrus]|uniref:Nudix_hydro domain-containing protein n=1 Tax=Heligmosomoides polygyrus TaxID=6339 RepID=A0A183FSI8_HELPZ|nr:unnamed protein product [Heligmosomoides polygyrus]
MSDLVRILKLMPLVKDLPIFDCNQYGDAVVESKAIPPNLIQSGRFFTLLGYQVELWRFQGVKGVEVVVHPWDGEILPELLKRGYGFYKIVERKLVLNRWIGDGPSRFPS